jgi:type IV pilus assembly protein PilP
MRINSMSFVIAAAIVFSATSALAQTPAPVAAAGQPEAPAASAVVLPTPPADFVYSSEGRRDPFLSLVDRGADTKSGASVKRVEGVAGLQTSEITVRGIVQSRGAWAAMVKGPDGKMYTLRSGDHLSDGTVHAVTAQFVAVLQEVKDPLSLEKQREVRKYLRGGEEVK